MSFTVSDIPNPSEKRYLFKKDGKIHKTTGTELNSPTEFLDPPVWFSVANYSDPHLTDSDIIGSTFAVELPSKYVDRYIQIMQNDLGITLSQIEQDSTTILLSDEFTDLTDFQRYKLASYPDIRDCTLDQLTDPTLSYNQNHQETDFNSTYGNGMSHRVYEYIHTELETLVQKEEPVKEIQSYLTGRNTEGRAEQIVEVLEGNQTESVLYELGSLKPKQAFSQVVDEFYTEAIEELSIPVEYKNILTDVSYIKIPSY